MKPLILPLAGGAAALALLASALPLSAHAQLVIGDAVDANAVVGESGRWPLTERERWLAAHLGMARSDGTLSDAEYYRLRDQLGQIRSDQERMRAVHDNMLTENDRLSLASRLDEVASRLRESGFQQPW